MAGLPANFAGLLHSDQALVACDEGLTGLIDFGTVSAPAQAAPRASELLNASRAPAATPSSKYLGLGAAISAALREDSRAKVAGAVRVFAGT